jgi:hypothetical protein
MALTQPQQTALEAAILAYLSAQGGRFARTAAAMAEEAQFTGGKEVQTESGGEVLEKAWAPFVQNRVFDTAIAITGGNLAEIQLHVWMGIDVEAQRYVAGGSAFTPLRFSALMGRLVMVKYFIALSFDMDAADDNNGLTALSVACLRGHVDVMEYLLDQGCDRDHADNNGYTAIHWAAIEGHFEAAQLLFRYGATLDARTNAGYTPADFATDNGHHHIADAIRAEIKWVKRRMAMFVAFNATCAEGVEQPLLARFRVEYPDILRHVILFL